MLSLRRSLALMAAAFVLAACSSSGPNGGQSPSDAPTPVPTGTGAAPASNGSTWRVSNAEWRGSQGIEGFANRSSILPGEEVTLYVSSPTPTYRVAAFRVDGTTKSGAVSVWKSGALDGERQTATTVDEQTRAIRADWAPSTTVSTEGWRDGMYVFRLAATDGSASYVPLVVRSESTEGKVVLAFSVQTYQAYNEWGGKSAYKDLEKQKFQDRSYAVSFDRPYSKGKGTGGYLSYDNPFVLQAQSLGIPLAYETDLDIATVPDVLKGARGLVSLGHDEYWSGAQRTAVEAARDAGTNLAFMGANVSYWQVRLQESPLGPNRVMDIYKSDADPVSGDEATLRFRDLKRPENQMTGQLYECFPAKGNYTVLNPGFFLYEGSGAKKGSQYPGIGGPEVDRVYPLKSTPRPIEVVAKTKTTCGDNSTWATSSYYTNPSGAGVFSVGTMGWILRGMDRDTPPKTAAFVRTVNANLMRAMAAGPMGAAHPATDNLDSLDLPSTNTTGAA